MDGRIQDGTERTTIEPIITFSRSLPFLFSSLLRTLTYCCVQMCVYVYAKVCVWSLSSNGAAMMGYCMYVWMWMLVLLYERWMAIVVSRYEHGHVCIVVYCYQWPIWSSSFQCIHLALGFTLRHKRIYNHDHTEVPSCCILGPLTFSFYHWCFVFLDIPYLTGFLSPFHSYIIAITLLLFYSSLHLPVLWTITFLSFPLTLMHHIPCLKLAGLWKHSHIVLNSVS